MSEEIPEIQNQKSLKSRVRDELNALRQQEIAKNRRGQFKDEGSTFLTPEEAQIFLADLRLKKKAKEQPTPPTNLPSSELNDWYSRQRKMQLDEQQKRVEAEEFLRGYRSKLDYVNQGSNSPRRTKNGIDHVDVIENGVESVMLEVSKFESKSAVASTLTMKKENKLQKEELSSHLVENDDIVEDDKAMEENLSPDLSGEELNENRNYDIFIDEKPLTEEEIHDKDIDIPSEQLVKDDKEDTGEEVKPMDVEEELSEVIVGCTFETTEEFSTQTVKVEEPTQLVEKDDADTETAEEDNEVVDTVDESWRDMISREPGARFAPEADRYHLYVSHACPWAHRTVLVVALKGLEDVIGITYVHPTWQYTKPDIDEHRGWVFGSKDGDDLTSTSGSGSFPSSWGEEDPNMGAKTIRDIYELVNDTTERYILPVLWDKKLQTIVSNESSEIIRMLNSEFNEFAKNPDVDLYPDSYASKIDEINQWIYPTFNNGVYRCGLASTQDSYDLAIDELTEAFDKIDSILQKQRYIAGNVFTEADVRLFVTLIRFDEVYDIYFKTNTRSVASTPAVLNYVRDIYQMDNVAKTCVMEMIKAHYYTSHVELNKYSIIPRGVDFIGLLKKPHHRETLS